METYIKCNKNDTNLSHITYMSELILDIEDVKDLIRTAIYVSATIIWRIRQSFMADTLFHKLRTH